MFDQCQMDSRSVVRIPAAWRALSMAFAALIIASLFYVGSQPVAVGLVAQPWDKLAHLATFAAIAALLWVAATGRGPLLIVAMASLVGALDEWHQASLPGRHADVTDLLADIIAAGMTVLLLRAGQK